MSRTNEERRRETIGRLIEATIESLAETGYSDSSTNKICRRAGVSQGGLFNHFDTRADLIVAAAEEICGRHLEAFAEPNVGRDVRGVVEFIRAATRTPEHAAWHEIVVAARTDAELRERIAPSVRRFESALLGAASRVLGIEGERAERIGLVALSIMHMFDSEAVTSAAYPNPEIEERRVAWATELLTRELS